MKRVALGRLRILPEQYYALTFNELDCMLEGFRSSQLERWRMVRKQLTLLYNLNVDKKDRKSESEYMPLDDDVEPADNNPADYTPPKVFLGVLQNIFNLKERGPQA